MTEEFTDEIHLTQLEVLDDFKRVYPNCSPEVTALLLLSSEVRELREMLAVKFFGGLK